ncbi:general transcription factor 3C polypeptide 3-like isoform X2 [Zophobas morio]|uniref:general transcription factor 3C polypeptide 3-like isoform X2 n=1 Tax=Zophobas morio TaxID=2755281 RepID=UPI003082F0D1
MPLNFDELPEDRRTQDFYLEVDCLPDEEIENLIIELSGIAQSSYNKRRGRKKLSALREKDQKLLGEANLQYMSQNYQEAISLCKKVARSVPHCAQTYSLLALIYEDLGDYLSQATAALLEAQLSRGSNRNKWKKLGDLFRTLNLFDKAIYCFTRSLQLCPEDADDLWDRSMVYAALGHYRRAAEGLLTILKLPGKEHDLQVVYELATIYHSQLNQTKEAIELLNDALGHNPLHIPTFDLLYKLLMYNGQYERAKLLCNKSFLECERPLSVTVKIALCLVYLFSFEEAAKFLRCLESHAIEEVSDFYVEIIEAYVAVGEYAKALYLCDVIMGSVEANVWYLRGKCEQSLGLLEECVLSLETVLKFSEFADHKDQLNTRLLLSTVYGDLGLAEKSLTVVRGECLPRPTRGFSDVDVDSQVLLSRCSLFLSEGDFSGFLNIALPVIIRLSHHARLDDRLTAENNESFLWRYGYSKLFDEWLVLITNTLRVLIYLEKYETTEKTFYCLEYLSGKLKNFVEQKKSILLLALWFNVKSRNYKGAYLTAKKLLFHNLNTPGLLEFMHYMLLLTRNYSRAKKMVCRLRARHKNNFTLAVLSGHHYMHQSSTSYILAIGEYHHARVLQPANPLLFLYLGIAYLAHAMKRTCLKKKKCLHSAFANLYNYYNALGGCREASYNLGRAYHQIGLLHIALIYYDRCLTSLDNKLVDELGKKAAYNISRIYIYSGNELLAKMYLDVYCLL